MSSPQNPPQTRQPSIDRMKYCIIHGTELVDNSCATCREQIEQARKNVAAQVEEYGGWPEGCDSDLLSLKGML